MPIDIKADCRVRNAHVMPKHEQVSTEEKQKTTRVSIPASLLMSHGDISGDRKASDKRIDEKHLEKKELY